MQNLHRMRHRRNHISPSIYLRLNLVADLVNSPFVGDWSAGGVVGVRSRMARKLRGQDGHKTGRSVSLNLLGTGNGCGGLESQSKQDGDRAARA
jgi:hypothetical protein